MAAFDGVDEGEGLDLRVWSAEGEEKEDQKKRKGKRRGKGQRTSLIAASRARISGC